MDDYGLQPGTLQQPQPLAGTLAPQPAPQMQQQPMQQPMMAPQQMPMMAPQQMPYGYGMMGGGQGSVLSDDAHQQKMAKLWDAAADSQFDTMRQGKGEQVVNDIFGKLVGPAMAAFGGYGVGQGGLQLIQKADQDLKDKRAENQQKLASSAQLMNNVTNLVDRTSPGSLKALAQYHKDFNDQQNRTSREAIAAQREEGRSKRFTELTGMKSDQFAAKMEQEKTKTTNLEKWRDTLDQKYHRDADNYIAINKARMAVQAKLAEMADNTHQRAITSQEQNQAAQLHAQLARMNMAEEVSRAKVNIGIQEAMKQTNTNGSPKFPGLNLAPLDSAQATMEEPFNSPETQNAEPAIQEILGQINGGQPGQSEQPTPGQPQQPQAGQQADFKTQYTNLTNALNNPNLPQATKDALRQRFIQIHGSGGASI